jgi:hypothetical protein
MMESLGWGLTRFRAARAERMHLIPSPSSVSASISLLMATAPVREGSWQVRMFLAVPERNR